MRLLRIDSHSHNELNITQSERNCGYSADRGCRIALRTKGEGAVARRSSGSYRMREPNSSRRINPELMVCVFRLQELKFQLEFLQAALDTEVPERSRIALASSLIEQAFQALSDPKPAAQ